MKHIDEKVLQELQGKAGASPRGRANLNLHQNPEDPVQRFLNAIEPNSYVRPHRHHAPPRWELFTAIRGRVVVLIFTPEGVVAERTEIAADGETRIVEIPAGAWHTVAALQPGTVLLEVKQGPYLAPGTANFAAWAPPEGEAACAQMVHWYHHARPGDSFNGRSRRETTR